MEILNAEFGREITPLPPATFCLNSEWEDARSPAFHGERTATAARASLVHFSALGKPWSYSPPRARRLRPHAHPFFHQLWTEWWRLREKAVPAPAWLRFWRRLQNAPAPLTSASVKI